METECNCRGYDPADPCGHGDTSEGCPVHDPNAYEDIEFEEEGEQEELQEFVAWFPKMAQAVEFAARISGAGWSAVNVVQKGRTVTFLGPNSRQYFLDMLESVGYYGSTQVRKATLDGVPAPIAY